MNTNNGQFGYTVDLEKILLHSERSSEQYGHWEESYHNYFKSIRRSTGYTSITSDLDLPVGIPCFLVWVEWSSGDSFGQGFCNNAEAVAVFDDYEDANNFSHWIRKNRNYRDEGFEYSQHYITAKGEDITVYLGSWVGYFETLESVHIEHTVIQA